MPGHEMLRRPVIEWEILSEGEVHRNKGSMASARVTCPVFGPAMLA
jgi:hypothetical protein